KRAGMYSMTLMNVWYPIKIALAMLVRSVAVMSLKIQLLWIYAKSCCNFYATGFTQALTVLLLCVGRLADAQAGSDFSLSQPQVLSPGSHRCCSINCATDDV